MSPATTLFAHWLALCSTAAAFSAAAAPPSPGALSALSGPNAKPPPAAHQSEAPETAPRGRDLKTIIGRLLGMKRSSEAEKPKRLQLLLLPVINVRPSRGFLFGVEADGTYQGKARTQEVSSFDVTMAYDTKRQVLISADYDLFSAGNRWNLVGDSDWNRDSQEAFRLGGAPPRSRDSQIDYQFLGTNQIIRRRIGPGLYAGPGYHLARYQNIAATPAAAAVMAEYQSSGVRPRSSSTASGVSMDLLYETRDNPINARHGVYASLSYRVYPKLLGSDGNWQSLLLEGRVYPHVPAHSRNVLALWLLGSFTLAGKPPYLVLPAIASDPLGQAGRGYVNGRYRGRNLLYGEAEYRMALSQDDFWGGVLFVNVTSVTEPGSTQFKYLNPAAGVGLRVKFNRNNGSNLAIDYAWGKQSSGELYVGLNEAF